MTDWTSFHKHRQHLIKTTGQWAGLLNEDGEPLHDLPPVIDIQGDTTRTDLSELTITLQVKSPTGTIHPIVNDIIADQLGKTDNQARLQPAAQPTRFICFERPGLRRTYKIMFCVAHGTHTPSTITIHAVTILDLLNGLPAWSNPRSIDGEFKHINQDFATMWKTPRNVAGFTLATKADGYTVHGPATTAIKRIIDESMNTTMKLTGHKDPPIVCTIAPGPSSPDVFIRPEDDSVWDTVVPIATAAGVEIGATLWFPGDENPLQLSKPTVVVTLRQQERN